jgi:hypothetical protein
VVSADGGPAEKANFAAAKASRAESFLRAGFRRPGSAVCEPIRCFDKCFNLYDVTRNQVSMFPGYEHDCDVLIYDRDTDDPAVCESFMDLVQASFAQSTRVTYHRYCILFARFCAMFDKPPLPVDADTAVKWLHTLNLTYAGKTVNVAISAIISWSALNNLANPVAVNPILRLAWRAVRKHRFVRVKLQKFPIDAKLLVNVWRYFLAEFVGTNNFVALRAMGMMLTGVEAGTRVKELRLATVCNWHDVDSETSALQLLGTKANFLSALSFSRVALAVASYPLTYGPSAARYMREVYMPALRGFRVARHPRCRNTIDSTAACGFCPRLFPTLNAQRNSFGTVTAQHFTDQVRFFMRVAGIPGEQIRMYSGVSCRRTTATLAALEKADKQAIAYHLRHQSGVTDVYTDLREQDRREVSIAIQRAVVKTINPKAADSNDDACYVCGDGGRLVLCDLCSAAAHARCVGLMVLPARDTPWFCTRCAPRQVVLE